MQNLIQRQESNVKSLSANIGLETPYQEAIEKSNYSFKNNIQTQSGENSTFFTISPKVLLVEDTPIIQLVNTKLLTMLGCQVDLAPNGKAAIEMHKNRYDIILMDVDLPDINGIEATKAIRQLEKDMHTPIVALTARGDGAEKACIEAGMDDFYVKPILTEGLTQILKRWLPNHSKH